MNLGVGERPTTIDIGTTAGTVRGYRQNGVLNFRGIPYGDRVDGDRRFKAPVPVLAWSGVVECRRTGPRAVQRFGSLFQTRTGDYYSGGRIGELGLNDQRDSENCLVLNVLAPAAEDATRPVMVYIHGGGFSEGSGVLGVAAQRLVHEQNVVLVSVNHRLNVFGYLHLGDLDPAYAGSGNVGMLDLVLALQWVRDNIAAFGGDAGNVTIFGESGGGVKVSTLLAMPAAAGLFHRAIVQSGASLTAQDRGDATRRAEELLRSLEIPVDDIGRLTTVPAPALLEAAGSGLGFGPVVDGVVLPRHSFVPDAPELAAHVPLLVGHCEDETNWLFSGDESVYWLSESELHNRLSVGLGIDESAAAELVAEYRAVHADASPTELYLRITSDGYFGYRASVQADRKASQPASVFRYLFTYDTPLEGGRYAAFHTAELPLIFRLVDYPEMEGLSRQISAQWAAFARSGDPSLPDLEWPPYDTDTRPVMILDTPSFVARDPQSVERRLWERRGEPELDGLIRHLVETSA